MPGMDGLALCRKVREIEGDFYIYFILLTAKSEKGAVAEGLDVGADDFLTKPVNAEELRARISAGDRILKMERELFEKNRLISSTLAEISALYEAVDRDLAEARKMQQALVSERFRDFGSATVSLMLQPSGHVGGDLVGFFEAGARKVALFSIDVSGHGIASALMTSRLAGYLSDSAPARNIALIHDGFDSYIPRPPQEAANLLNKVMLEEMQSDLYCTMVLAYVDLKTGDVDITQCGHPNPAIVDPQGEVRFFGEGGLPIGLLDGADYTQWRFRMKQGERLILYSDGFTECENTHGVQLDESGFSNLIKNYADLTGTDFCNALVWGLDAYREGQESMDDVSCAVLAFNGAPAE